MSAARRGAASLVLAAIIATLTAQAAWAPRVGVTTLLSRAKDAGFANGSSESADLAGPWVAYASDASNIADDPASGFTDILVTSVHEPGTVIASRSGDPSGQPADGQSMQPSVSGDGRFVAFASKATNLLTIGEDLDQQQVTIRTNGKWQVYLHDRALDGEYPLDRPGNTRTFLVSRTAQGAAGNGDSTEPSIPDSGASVAFTSDATDLVAGDTNGLTDVFVYSTLTTPAVRRISSNAIGQNANGRSMHPEHAASAHVVVFASDASNIVPNDTNGKRDIFRWEDFKGITRVSELAPVGAARVQSNGDSDEPTVTADGSIIAFSSLANNLTSASDGQDLNTFSDIYLRDLRRNAFLLVSVTTSGEAANGPSRAPSIAGGWLSSFVGSPLRGSDGVPELEDAYRLLDDTDPIQPGPFYLQVSGWGVYVEIESVGVAVVAFESEASNLLDPLDGDADTNDVADVYRRDVFGQLTERVSLDSSGAEAGLPSSGASISHGDIVVFESEWPFEFGEQTQTRDIFLRNPHLCASGAAPRGPVSGITSNYVEPAVPGKAGQLVHNTNCEAIAPAEQLARL